MTNKINTKRNRSNENSKEVERVKITLDDNCILDFKKFKVKNDANRFLTTEMFDDHRDNRRLKNKISPYSLYNEEHVKLEDGSIIYSMKKIFLDSNDTTGYICAKQCLGSYEHWQKLLCNSVIKEEVDKWIEELKVRELALAKRALMQEIQTQGRGQVSAARLIVNLNNQDPNSKLNYEKTSNKNKDKIEKEEVDLEMTNEEHNAMLEDLKRLNN